jgi:hypothetical protein
LNERRRFKKNSKKRKRTRAKSEEVLKKKAEIARRVVKVERER